MRMSQRLSEKLLAKEKKKMHDMMAKILADEEMDVASKKAAIREMRAKAERDQELALQKAKLILSSQQATRLV